MTDPGAPHRRAQRRRRRARPGGPAEPSAAGAVTAPAASTDKRTDQPTGPAPTKARKGSAKTGQGRRRDRGAGDTHDRGLRDLIGGGPSQLGVSRAARGRDVNRPTDDDIATAEADLVIVRRNWRPEN